MAHYNFKKDITEGENGEKIVLKDLQELGADFVSFNKDENYDLLVLYYEDEVTYEIKTDVFCKPDRDTGNIFIEYECRGKASGINVTKSDWFVTFFKELREIWYIRTEDLKNLIEDNDFKMTELSGDAYSETKGYLIPRYQFKSHFIIRTVPKEWLKEEN